jgi:hypothetical protein
MTQQANETRMFRKVTYDDILCLPTLCMIWDPHGGDYEECRLLGCENLILTSQETHYISGTEPRRLMLCKS